MRSRSRRGGVGNGGIAIELVHALRTGRNLVWLFVLLNLRGVRTLRGRWSVTSLGAADGTDGCVSHGRAGGTVADGRAAERNGLTPAPST